MDTLGSFVARSEGRQGDGRSVQGYRLRIQLAAREARAYLEHPRGAEQQLAQGRLESGGGRVNE